MSMVESGRNKCFIGKKSSIAGFVRFLIIHNIAAEKIVTFRPKTSSFNAAVSTLSPLALFTTLVVSAKCLWYKGGIESRWSVKLENKIRIGNCLQRRCFPIL